MKKILSLALAVLMLAAGTAWAAAPKTVLRMSIGDPDNSDMGIVANAFKKYVEEKSNGTVEVEIFYAGGLGEDEGVQFRNTQTGKLDLALGGIANLEPMVKRLGVLTLPYLFNDIEQVKAGVEAESGELLNSYAQEAGLRILAWTFSGFRYITNSKHPITRSRGAAFPCAAERGHDRDLPARLAAISVHSGLEHDLQGPSSMTSWTVSAATTPPSRA